MKQNVRRESVAFVLIALFASSTALAQTKVPESKYPPVRAPEVEKPAVTLSPQRVVELALSQGTRVKAAEAEARRAYLPLYQALGEFDFQLSVTAGWEYTEAQALTGFANPSDRTFDIATVLSKKFETGTTLSLAYQDIRQNSELSAFTATTRPPSANLNALELTARQALLRNAFGYADRLAVEVGERSIEAALENREEQFEEVVLSAMTLYWNAYIAEQQLKENVLARDKYLQLVKDVKRRARLNLSTPGELPRLEAELEMTEQRAQASSADYVNAIDSLLTAVRLDASPESGVRLEIPKELPDVPKLEPKRAEELRAVKVAKINQLNTQRNLDAAKSRVRPRLDLIARAATTGVDQESNNAFREMIDTTYPTYFVGVEFQTPLGSDLIKGQIENAAAEKSLADAQLQIALENSVDQLDQMQRLVASRYQVARLASETVTLRERVVREIDRAYQQGRQPLVELIRANNELFSAQLERARAIGQYHIGLNQLAAARDELVTKKR